MPYESEKAEQEDKASFIEELKKMADDIKERRMSMDKLEEKAATFHTDIGCHCPHCGRCPYCGRPYPDFMPPTYYPDWTYRPYDLPWYRRPTVTF